LATLSYKGEMIGSDLEDNDINLEKTCVRWYLRFLLSLRNVEELMV